MLPPIAHRYRIHGMTIDVDRPVPRLSPVMQASEEPVTLSFGPVPLALDPAESSDEFFQANDREYLFREHGSWAALNRDGRTARFEALGPLSEEMFWYIALTNAVGVAGYQRGMFPLHASSVAFSEGLVAFVGRAGSGKTTLTAGLILRGLPLVSDDLTLIKPQGAGYASGRGAPEIRLLRDAIGALDWDRTLGRSDRDTRAKLAFVPHLAEIDDLPVRGIVELAYADGPPRLDRLQGADPLRVLAAAIRLRMGLHLFPPARRAMAFALTSAMARTIPVYRLTRPRNFAHFAAGADLICRAFGG